jgi:hypothetical protein
MLKFAKVTSEQVLDILRTDSANGLDKIAVENLQKTHGPNKLEVEEKVRGLVFAALPPSPTISIN